MVSPAGPCPNSAGPAGAGGRNPVRITERQCALPTSTQSPHRNNLITVKTTSLIPAFISQILGLFIFPPTKNDSNTQKLF